MASVHSPANGDEAKPSAATSDSLDEAVIDNRWIRSDFTRFVVTVVGACILASIFVLHSLGTNGISDKSPSSATSGYIYTNTTDTNELSTSNSTKLETGAFKNETNAVKNETFYEYMRGWTCPNLPSLSDSIDLYMGDSFREEFTKDVPALEMYFQLLYPHMFCPSQSPLVNTTPPGPIAYNCSADKYGEWDGERDKPAVLVEFIPVAYELDVLEIKLYEHDRLVDFFVLGEGTHTQRVARKPLALERNFERFDAFRDKILHVVLDDGPFYQMHRETENTTKVGNDWRGEDLPHQHMWMRFIESRGGMAEFEAWEEKEESAGGAIIFVDTDGDEIIGAEQLAHFKYCNPSQRATRKIRKFQVILYRHVFDWRFPNLGGARSRIFQRRHVHADNTYGKDDAVAYNGPGETGFHLNRMTSAYADIFKDLSIAEGGSLPRHNLSLARDPLLTNDWRRRLGLRNCCPGDGKYLVRTKSIKDSPMPWLAVQNKERYRHMFYKEFPDG